MRAEVGKFTFLKMSLCLQEEHTYKIKLGHSWVSIAWEPLSYIMHVTVCVEEEALCMLDEMLALAEKSLGAHRIERVDSWEFHFPRGGAHRNVGPTKYVHGKKIGEMMDLGGTWLRSKVTPMYTFPLMSHADGEGTISFVFHRNLEEEDRVKREEAQKKREAAKKKREEAQKKRERGAE